MVTLSTTYWGPRLVVAGWTPNNSGFLSTWDEFGNVPSIELVSHLDL